MKRANNKPALDRDLQLARVPFHRRRGEIEAEYVRLAAKVPQELHPKLSEARDQEMCKLAEEFNPQFEALRDFHNG